MLANLHAESGAGPPSRLFIDLQETPVDDHGIVGRDDALVFLTQNRIEIGVSDGDERIGRIRRLAPERGVVLGQVVVAQVLIGGRHRANARHAEAH